MTRRSGPPVHAAFAVAAPGLAPLVADELRALGLTVREVEDAGVAFDATDVELWTANLWLRTASRVLVRLASFRATAFHELEREARRVPWERILTPESAVGLRVTCRKSRLYHSDAVAERVAGAIAHRLGGTGGFVAAGDDAREEDGSGAGPDDDGAHEAPPLVVVRFFRDRCTISADSSGALLHRRGYRQALARAPLRETLAAAVLLAAGYDGSGPLLDPLCGSGTLPIEAALIARRLAPGRRRDFAFMRWPGFDARRWAGLLAEADARALPAPPHPIVGSDRDAGAIEAARSNAERAGVAADVAFVQRPLSAAEPPADGAGWVVTNPPYGKRVGEAGPLRDLYARLGQLLALRCPGWTAALIAPEDALLRQLRLPLARAVRTSNGGLDVGILVGRVPGAPERTPDGSPEGTDAGTAHPPHVARSTPAPDDGPG